MTQARQAKRDSSTPFIELFCAAIIVVSAGNTYADLSSKKVRRSQPARTTQTAPDTTGAIAKSQAPQPKPQHSGPEEASAKPENPILTPFYLPNVPRTLMRACGETWRAKKMAGNAGDDDWREFAINCLAAAKDAPQTR